MFVKFHVCHSGCFLFLRWITLNIKVPLILKVGKKRALAEGNCKRTLNIEFEQDWSVGLGANLGDATYRKLKTIFLVSGIFPGKADSAIFLGFECTINPQNLMKIVGAIFEKIKFFFIFFSCELPLILGVGAKLKKGSTYLQEDPRYRIWMRSVDWFRLYDRRRTDTQTDTHTHTHTHTDIFLKHIFRLWEWCRVKNCKKKNRSRICWRLQYFLHS